MSSTTKYPLIDKNSIKESEELETTEQLYRSLSDYERSIREENDSQNRNQREHYV